MTSQPVFQHIEYDEFEGVITCKKEHVRDEHSFAKKVGTVMKIGKTEVLIVDSNKDKSGGYVMEVASFK